MSCQYKLVMVGSRSISARDVRVSDSMPSLSYSSVNMMVFLPLMDVTGSLSL